MDRTKVQSFISTFLFLLLLVLAPAGQALAQEAPVVKAVMFWMNGCPHCHHVLDNVLPPLKAQYGDQLQILLVEIRSAEQLDQLYAVAGARGLPKEQTGVPLMLVGEALLVGSQQIPAEFPALIEQYLAAGGVDYPDLPELAPFLPVEAESEVGPMAGEPVAIERAAEAQAGETTAAPASPPLPEPDRSGFILAWVVLGTMLLTLGYVFARWLLAGRPVPRLTPLRALLPLLALAGLGVAAYLAYVETQAVPAVCGPVGDCNAVQQSSYATLFGFLPVGLLGIAGYLAILVAWAAARRRRPWALASLLVMTAGGVLFSIYLTYLELFVIEAVCIWCLSSAVIMALLLLASVEMVTPPQRLAVRRRRA